MESTGCVIKRENTAARHGFAVISAVWFVLSGSSENVCAQNIASEDRMASPLSRTAVSKYETFATRPNPPAIVMERNIASSDIDEAAPNPRIIADPVMEREKPASVQPIASTPAAVQADSTYKKVTATTEDAPVAAHTTSVTLWDEIAPPAPAPVPVDAATRAAAGDVASVGAQRTQ
jgi:hypothetical protein